MVKLGTPTSAKQGMEIFGKPLIHACDEDTAEIKVLESYFKHAEAL